MKKNEIIEIEKIAESENLEKATASQTVDRFAPYVQQVAEWSEQAQSIVVEDENDKAGMKAARELRLTIRQVRIDADKTRKELKEDSLKYGRAVQNIYNKIESMIKPIEALLQEKEDTAARIAEERRNTLRATREGLVASYRQYIPASVDLSVLTDEEFYNLSVGAKLQHENAERLRIEQEQAELARIELARIEAETREQQRQKELQEAREREAAERAAREKAEAERKAAEEKSRKEREKLQAKLDAEKAQREAAERAAREKAEAERKAAEEKSRKEREKLQAKLDAEKAQREAAERAAREKAESAATLQGLIDDLSSCSKRCEQYSQDAVNDIQRAIAKLEQQQ